MFKKFIITGFAAIAMMVGMQAPASAAMSVAKPAAATNEAATALVEVRGRRGGGFRRGGFRRGGKHWGHRRWRHRHWRHYGYRHYYHGGAWKRYRHCRWLQRRGHRIRCYRPGYRHYY